MIHLMNLRAGEEESLNTHICILVVICEFRATSSSSVHTAERRTSSSLRTVQYATNYFSPTSSSSGCWALSVGCLRTLLYSLLVVVRWSCCFSTSRENGCGKATMTRVFIIQQECQVEELFGRCPLLRQLVMIRAFALY